MNRLRTSTLLPLLTLLPLAACGGGGASESGDGETSSEASSSEASGEEGSGSEASGEEGSGEEDTGTDTGINPDDFEKWEIRMPNFSPPSFAPTYYGCYSQTFEVPAEVQLVGFEPVVDDPHVHHYVVQVLDTPTNDNPAVPCLEEPWDDMIWGWAPGGEPLFLPEEAGFLTGSTGTVTIRFQVHYDNPLNESFTDNGGFNVYYLDDNLRPNNAGIATFGDINGIHVPAGQTAEHVASCSESFTSTNFPEDMHILGSWLHAHEIGSVLWGEVTPAGGGAPFELGREDPYRFDYQTFKPVEDVVLHPGDRVDTHCVFDNTEGTSDVSGGPETQNEMCINFLLYYPKVDTFDECGNL